VEELEWKAYVARQRVPAGQDPSEWRSVEDAEWAVSDAINQW
jgi:hypothetical protein